MNKKKDLNQLKEEYETISMSERQVQSMKDKIEQAKIEKKRINRKNRIQKTGIAVAAAIAVFIILPNTSAGVAYAMSDLPIVGKLVDVITFRDYKYEDDRNTADIDVPELVSKNTVDMKEVPRQTEEKLQKTTEEINKEIATITDQLVAEFEEGLKMEDGYQDMTVKHEVISTTDQYFVLKLICFQSAGSGSEWDYYYTIDLNTGERIALKDLFKEGTDYITPVSDDIKKQMKEQMTADEGIMYWLDQTDVPEWNFKGITEETAFYINSDNQLVICFNEGDVAPMYMGCVEFVINDTILKDIRK